MRMCFLYFTYIFRCVGWVGWGIDWRVKMSHEYKLLYWPKFPLIETPSKLVSLKNRLLKTFNGKKVVEGVKLSGWDPKVHPSPPGTFHPLERQTTTHRWSKLSNFWEMWRRKKARKSIQRCASKTCKPWKLLVMLILPILVILFKSNY